MPPVAEFDGAPFAYNEAMSQSGWAAPYAHATSLGIGLVPAMETGGHRLSALAVLSGKADFAALDAVTWRMLRRWEPAMDGLKVVGSTAPTPGLPYIAASTMTRDLLFPIVARAIAVESRDDRDATGIRALVAIPAEAYLAVPTPPAP